MNLFAFAGIVVAFCCVCKVERACAGTSVSESISQSLDAGANAASIVDTAIKVKESVPRSKKKKLRVIRSTSISTDFKGSMQKFKEWAAHMADQFAANIAIDVYPEPFEKVGDSVRAYKIKIQQSGVRPEVVTTNHIFKTLDGPLDKNFQDLLENNLLNTGDIISCRLNGSSVAEHYMMIIDDKTVVEIAVRGGKSSDQGYFQVIPVTQSNYINSNDCLYHDNFMIEAAIDCDEKLERKKSKKKMVQFHKLIEEISKRITSTTPQLTYSVLTCNCQDLVLYWAYGLVTNRRCIGQFFKNGVIKGERSLRELRQYVYSSCHKKGLGK